MSDSIADQMRDIDCGTDQLVIIQTILAKHVAQYAVWVFGSRIRADAKPYSDLDLVIMTEQPLDLSVYASLVDDFDESDLPWRVDVVDWACTTAEFQQIILANYRVLQHALDTRACHKPAD